MSSTTIAPGRFQCPVCPVRSETVGDKRRHLKTEHGATPSTTSNKGESK